MGQGASFLQCQAGRSCAHEVRTLRYRDQYSKVTLRWTSLITGDLINKFGHKKMIYAGIIIMFSTIATHFVFETYYGYMIGLILLGVGWNFLFVSGTSLLVVSYNKEDKFLAQGLNDFVVFSSQSIGALSAGILLFSTSWKTLNLICLPLLILLLLFSLLNKKN